MTDHRLTLSVLPDGMAVCRLAGDAALPSWALESPVPNMATANNTKARLRRRWIRIVRVSHPLNAIFLQVSRTCPGAAIPERVGS